MVTIKNRLALVRTDLSVSWFAKIHALKLATELHWRVQGETMEHCQKFEITWIL